MFDPPMAAASADSIDHRFGVVHGKSKVLAELVSEACKFGHIHADGITAVEAAQVIMGCTSFFAELIAGAGGIILDEALELPLSGKFG